MPRTKQMESRILDFPDPLSPVIALKWGSNLRINNKIFEHENLSKATRTWNASGRRRMFTYPAITVRCAYDLKPSTTISLICISDNAVDEMVDLLIPLVSSSVLLACWHSYFLRPFFTAVLQRNSTSTKNAKKATAFLHMYVLLVMVWCGTIP